jgi:hypothetical protein
MLSRAAHPDWACYSNDQELFNFLLSRLPLRLLLLSQFEVKLRVWPFLALLVEATGASAADSLSFAKDIAPVVFEHCATCHRPGESGPFSLLTYTDVKKRARQIAEVTEKRLMPPWLPDGPIGQFLHDRRLSPSQVELFRQWYRTGAPEGNPADLPSMPHWAEGWQLGKPDLVVQMPKSYTLSAEGRDVYRNFVVPVAIGERRYVRAVEFRPDNRRIVHHAFVKLDGSGQAHHLEGKDGQPGFGGMNLPDGVKMPSGYFLSYQPGKMPSSEPPGYGWALDPGQELVFQTHLKPTGRPETLQAQAGLFFTDIKPTNSTQVFSLSSLNIDIPAGTNAWVLEDILLLPVAVDLLSVLPHAHYLGKRLEGFAKFPDGRSEAVLSIPDWDFNWQGDYRYAHPIHLPAGTSLHMRFVYDNSADNPRNPHQPPEEVLYGSQSLDEMGELWFQVRLSSTNETAQLANAYNEKNKRMFVSYNEFRLQQNPHDASARTELGFLEWTEGRVQKAIDLLRTAVQDDPSYDQPHYYLGVIYRTQNRLVAARTEFETATRLNPGNSKAFGNLAFVFLDLGNLDRAERSIREAVRLDPADGLAKETLDNIMQIRNKTKQ